MKTNVSITSLEAYRGAADIHASQELRVLADIQDHPATTRKEIAVRLGIDNSSVSGRVHHLMAIGEVFESGSRKCSVSGRKAKTLYSKPTQLDWAS